ncbi:hypothetical protein Tco_0524586 [Tanacetum coccineum]
METEDRGRASELAAGSSQAPITDSAEVRSSKRGAEVGLDHEGSKKQKTNEASDSVQEQPDEEEKELPQEDLQHMMMDFQCKRVGNHTEAYQIFTDMLKKFDRDDWVSKLIAENEHLKQTYKQFYESIKPARIRSNEQCDDLINQVNLKSVEISDLNASLQEKGLEITALKDDLRKLKGKSLVDNVVTKHTIDPEMLKIDVEPITPKLLNKRTAHSVYITHTQEEAAVLRDLVDHVKANYPLDHSLESACRYTKLIQELITNTSKTCPSINNSGVKPSTSASESQPSGNTKKDRIR